MSGLVEAMHIVLTAPSNNACTLTPANYAGAAVVGRFAVRVLGQGLRDLKLVPSQWRCLVPPMLRDG